MVRTRTTINRNLVGDMIMTSNEVNSGNGEKIAAKSVATSTSSLKDPATPTNNNKIIR